MFPELSFQPGVVTFLRGGRLEAVDLAGSSWDIIPVVEDMPVLSYVMVPNLRLAPNAKLRQPYCGDVWISSAATPGGW